MRRLAAPIVLAVLLAAAVMAIPAAYFTKYSFAGEQRTSSEGYGAVKSPAPAVAAENVQATTVPTATGSGFANVLLMLLASAAVSLTVTFLLFKARP